MVCFEEGQIEKTGYSQTEMGQSQTAVAHQPEAEKGHLPTEMVCLKEGQMEKRGNRLIEMGKPHP